MFELYPKINSVWKRDQKGKILPDFATDEIEYLSNNLWEWTEKVDGTNIRLGYDPETYQDDPYKFIGGRTNNAQIPPHLLTRLQEIMKTSPFQDTFGHDQVTLYGEGYGVKIQKGGGNYIPDGTDFVLFDVKIGEWWLKRPDVDGIATNLGLRSVRVVLTGTIHEAITQVRDQLFNSAWENVVPEGLVGTPKVHLKDRKGERIMTKVKLRDFDG